jgi:hypothetical protein
MIYDAIAGEHGNSTDHALIRDFGEPASGNEIEQLSATH